MFFVEEHRGSEVVPLEQIAVEELGVAADVDPKIDEQRFGHVAVRIGRRDAHRAAVAQKRLAVVPELVALGVAAKVIVVVEHQHALIRERPVPEVGGRQSREAAADDDEVVGLAGIDVDPGEGLKRALIDPPQRFDSARMLTAETQSRGRIRIGRGIGRLLRQRCQCRSAPRRCRRHRAPYRSGNPGARCVDPSRVREVPGTVSWCVVSLQATRGRS